MKFLDVVIFKFHIKIVISTCSFINSYYLLKNLKMPMNNRKQFNKTEQLL